MHQARATILALADLTPSAERADEALSIPLEWFRWLDRGLWDMLGSPTPLAPSVSFWNGQLLDSTRQQTPVYGVPLERQYADRLVAIQQLRSGSRPLRVGWLFVAGTAEIITPTGARVRRRIFHPLVTRPVAVSRNALVPSGDIEVTRFVTDVESLRSFEQGVEYGGGAIANPCTTSPELLQRLPRLSAYADALARAAGFHAGPLVASTESPEAYMRLEGLRIVAGMAVYCVDQQSQITRASTLRSWAEQRLDRPTAFHAMYVDTTTPEAAPPDLATALEVSVALTRLQREAVRRSRVQPVTVVSGGPGTGKSHTISAIVGDALARGESVLVAAKSDAAVDALIGLMERQPVASPVVFGSNERRDHLAQRLAAGQLQPAEASTIQASHRRLEAAIDARNEHRRQMESVLMPERLYSPQGAAELHEARRLSPGLFEPTADLDALLSLVVQLTEIRTGWLARRRSRRAERRLRSAARADPSLPTSDVIEFVTIARTLTPSTAMPSTAMPSTVVFNAEDDQTSGEPAEIVAHLDRADHEVHVALARWVGLETRSSDRLDRAGLAAIGALATALRSGRGTRRAQLTRIDDDNLTTALPLWVGTLGDIDDLLPPVAATFDVVLIDEASGIEQSLAAPALLRARRAVIVGDPFQLRHVSFVADATVQSVLDANDVVDGTARARLDVRRNSLFDAATSVASVVTLDEHFRSDPHLVEVVARRIYANAFQIATRSPLTESRDCIHVERVNGSRDGDNVVHAEINAIVSELRAMAARDERSVGVVTPFRAQADALEAAILAAFTGRQLEDMNLRVGTVHGFQGNERDVMLCSVGLGPDDASAMAFVEDRHLLAVFLTRARRRAIVYVSFDATEGSLLGEYIAQSDHPPGTPTPVRPLSPWAEQVIDDVRLAGLSIAASYPVGRHIVDGAMSVRQQPVALMCGLHPDGIDAHIERHLELHRLGWTLIDALESRWSDRIAELTLEIVERCRSGHPQRPEGTMPP